MKFTGKEYKLFFIISFVSKQNLWHRFILFTLMFFIAAPAVFAQSIMPAPSPTPVVSATPTPALTPSLERRFPQKRLN